MLVENHLSFLAAFKEENRFILIRQHDEIFEICASKQIRFSLPDEFSTNQAFELIDRASRKSEIKLLNLNSIEENSEHLTIQIECIGDFFSLNNFFREIQNSGRISTIKILEFNSGNQLRDKFPEDWIRFAKIDVSFFKFSGEE